MIPNKVGWWLLLASWLSSHCFQPDGRTVVFDPIQALDLNRSSHTAAPPLLSGRPLIVLFPLQSKQWGRQVNELISFLLTPAVSWGHLETTPFYSDSEIGNGSENMQMQDDNRKRRKCLSVKTAKHFWNPGRLIHTKSCLKNPSISCHNMFVQLSQLSWTGTDTNQLH